MRSSRAALAAAVVAAGIAACAALLASSAVAQRPEGGAIEISGRKVRCSNVEVVMDRRLPVLPPAPYGPTRAAASRSPRAGRP